MPSARATQSSRAVVHIIFFALLLDLLAFTIPLPLFPRLIDTFVKDEATAAAAASNRWFTALEHLSPGVGAGSAESSKSLLQHTLSLVRFLRTTLFSLSPVSLSPPTPQQQARWDLTLLGGLLSSLFSFCQFLVSPYLGRWSDKYGRRKVLLTSMIGNLLSAVAWVFAGGWGGYVGEFGSVVAGFG